jgi:hypothetical protein
MINRKVNMKQNVVFWTGVKSSDLIVSDKHGNFEYLFFSKKCWEWWCKKHDVIFYEYNTPADPDTGKHKVTWQRWFDVFDQLESANINYNKIAVVDGSSMIHWNTPNMFDLVTDELMAFQSLENLRWVYEGVNSYSHLFNNVNFDITKYISCGFQIFNESHKQFLQELKDFYFANLDEILKLQKTISRGTDQPIYNYLLQIKNIKVKSLPASYMITHMNRFNWFSHNWQLNEDNTPYFIKYGYIWFFSGFDRKQRLPLMQQTWNLIKHNYE